MYRLYAKDRFLVIGTRTALVMGIAMGLVACAANPPAATTATLYERDTTGGIHDLSPMRGERGALRLHMDGDEFECVMCHEGFSGDLGQAALEGTHAAIEFDHGANLLCLNCHHPVNSGAYVNHDGSEIPGDEPTRLCAKCHGPHRREWERDVHGRVNRYWDQAYGEQKKLTCIECHDPHRPKFPKMKPERSPVLTRFDLASPAGERHDG